MAFFQKKPQVSDTQPIYTIGATKNVLIIGLGNPGEEYKNTRHNIGFTALDLFAKNNDFPAWTEKKDLKCLITSTNLGDKRVILCKPMTFMNLSGESAQSTQHFFRIYNKNTLAVYDELAIPFGQLRTRLGGSDAGHNGVKSLIQHIGDDFGRMRIGIGTKIAENGDKGGFVLKKFSQSEQVDLPKIIRESNSLITEYIFSENLTPESRDVL